MNSFQKHSFVHYFFHIAIAIFLLFFLVFSENIFSKSLSYADNLVFGEPLFEISGESHVYKKMSFEKKKLEKKGVFFEKETFISQENSAIDLSFSDFTVVRSGNNTEFSVLSSLSPEVSLNTGKIWISTQEYVVTHIPSAQVETLAGTTIIKRTASGKVAVIAWEKPARITFLSEEDAPLWSFLLPSRHQIVFSPDDYFSAEEFSHLRFSKLKKEFPITKVESSEFISEQLGRDLKWKFSVLKGIAEKKDKFFGIEMEASLFSFSPNKKNEESKEQDRVDVMNIWEALDKKQFRTFSQKIKNLSPQRKNNFYKYASFFPNNEQAGKLFIKSFPRETGNLWKNLWTLESMIASDLKNNADQDRVRISIMKEAKEENYDPEEIQFFAVSLFKNYSENLSYSIIDFFYDANTYLIESESSPRQQLTRKLEIVNDVFSFTQDLIDRKEYLLARKVLDKVETYLSDDNSPLLLAKKKKILAEKERIRGEVEYAEILGDKNKEHIDSYLSIKESAERQLEEANFHAAPDEEEFSLQKVKDLFEEHNISSETLYQDSEQKQLFYFVQEKNENGILFSGTFNLQFEKFSQVLVYNNQEKRNDLQAYVFSFYEISEINQSLLSSLFAEKEEVVIVSNNEAIPSEIADLVHTLTQDAFIKNDVMVNSYDLKIIEINTSKITGAIAHYGAIQRQKEEEKRRKVFKKDESYLLNKNYSTLESYVFNCRYNVETRQVFDITATAYEKKILLAGTMTIAQMIEVLDVKAKKIREKLELKTETVLHLKSIGVSAQVENIEWKDENTLRIKNMEERSTHVEFNGIYKPFSQKFSQISFLNIAKNPVVLKKSITLIDLESDFQSQKETLIKKVENYKKTEK